MRVLDSFDQYLVSEDTKLLDAMSALDNNAKKTLFVVKDGKLTASLTDGDIRRWILKSGDLNATVNQFAHYKPKTLKEASEAAFNELVDLYHVTVIPQVDDDDHIVAMLVAGDHIHDHADEKIDVPVVIMAGGAGTRLYPYTKVLPKPLIPIGEVPIVERIIQFFCQQGCHRFYMIVNHMKNMIKAYFNEAKGDYELTFIDEDVPLGTGGGLSLLKGLVQGTFIFTNCDTIININYADVVRQHREHGHVATMICSAQKTTIPYGVVHTTQSGQLDYLEEKPVLPMLINTGSYIVDSSLVDSMEKGERIDFPTCLARQMRQGGTVGIYPCKKDEFLDMGQFDQMEHMKHVLQIND
ncbi:MAG: sugar phosphate nucleotidyltransferase [Clostridia bacterium]|nr:sugar phosphate nucleotidyltransferase [Clostridia bacterium]